MRVRVLCTVKRGGVYHPPGTPLDLDDSEIKALRGRVEVIIDPDDSSDATPTPEWAGDAAASPDAPPVDGAGAASLPGLPALPHDPAEEPGSEGQGGEDGGRVGDIARTIDTLDAEDFTQSGRPKVDALEAALGYRPGKDEVDAALALRETMAG